MIAHQKDWICSISSNYLLYSGDNLVITFDRVLYTGFGVFLLMFILDDLHGNDGM